ncbi:MAG: hypothetical protein Pg6C_19110 [Treponemataceae bacterium]|nr:MAG: hypothetical protein Pg6C_19110 [Treponemataceae bacterium]
MKRKLFNIVVLLVLALTLSVLFGGCVSTMFDMISGVQEVETVDSKQLKDAANDIILAGVITSPGPRGMTTTTGINVDAFKAAFERKFSGLTFSVLNDEISYQSKKYRMYFTDTGSSSGSRRILTSATKCVELQKKEKEEKEEK